MRNPLRASFLLLPMALIMLGCGSERSEQDLLNELADQRQQAMDEMREALVAAKEKELAAAMAAREAELQKRYSLKDVAPQDFALALCARDRHSLSQLFRVDVLKRYKKELGSDCSEAKDLVRTFPTMISKVTNKEKQDRFFFWRFDQQGKVSDFELLNDRELKVDHHMVPMKDGIKLSTFVFSKDKNQQETLLIRTPSYHYQLKRYVAYLKLALSAGFNVVLQENRGSRHSEGTFYFMHQHNIDDARDTLKWLATRSELSKDVVAFGEGYDAFNALAAGLTREKSIKSVISCSAPLGEQDKRYTFEMLKFVWLSETALPAESFEQEVQALLAQNIPLDRLDNLIFGRDVMDYQEFLSFQNDPSSLAAYWRQRGLGQRVKGMKVPVTHVAGLSDDATSVALFEKFPTWRVNNLHRLYLHKGGSGCGDLFSSPLLSYYVKGTNRRPFISRYFRSAGRQVNVNSLDHKIRYLEVPVEFKKPDLFSLFPSLETMFGFNNLAAMRLSSLDDQISTPVKLYRRQRRNQYLNGPVRYRLSVASRLSDRQDQLPVELTLSNNNKVLTRSHFTLSRTDNNKARLLNKKSPSTLIKISNSADYRVELINKASTDVFVASRQIKLFSGPPSNQGWGRDNIMTIPQSDEKPYILLPIEAF